MNTNALAHFDQDTTDALREALAQKHIDLAQHHLPNSERSHTARNYDSAIQQLGAFMAQGEHPLPTRGVLEQWRDKMLHDGYAVRTVNAKLAAARKVLRGVADDVTSVQVKMVLRDWASVPDAKAIITSEDDKTADDYGKRLTLPELQTLVNSIDTRKLKGLRDRAIIALMAGAGLRVSEVVALTLRDVFLTENERGQRGIKVRDGKHHKSRVVVLGGWNSWVIDAVEAYTNTLGKSPVSHPDATIFEGVKRVKGGRYASNGKLLSRRGAQRAVEAYSVQQPGGVIDIAAHDLRRTYAKLCKQHGMSWEALRANMGHSSVVITENYVGHEVDWSERVPHWGINLE